jgi:hypothetical protein
LERFRWKIEPYVIADLLSDFLHVSNQNTTSFVEVLPQGPGKSPQADAQAGRRDDVDRELVEISGVTIQWA